MTDLTYAIADLHGRFDLLAAAIATVEARATKPGKIVFLGDYVDRGPQSRQIVERLMSGPSAGWQWVCLKGNHEDMMVKCLRRRAPLSWWLGNGGVQTLISYGQKAGQFADPSFVSSEHVRWLDALPLMHVDTHRLFVHAGVDPTVPLEEQTEETLLWKRYPDGFAEGHGNLHVVHGHQPVVDGPMLCRGRTDLDTFAWRTGRLAVGVFDNATAGGPIDLIEVNVS